MNQSTAALHRIDIASPCTASWDRMKGDNRVRHCGDCNKNVFNLSAMPEAEAAAVLAGNVDGKLCVRFHRRQDGTVITSDCGAGARLARRKLPGMASLAFLALAVAGCAVSEPPPVANAIAPVSTVTMGAPPPPPPPAPGTPI